MPKKKHTPSDPNQESQVPFAADIPLLFHSREEQDAIQNFLWSLLVDNCIKLQLSSASIKAGVTSLLDHKILWSYSSQYDFFRSIDESIDEATDLIMLMMLTFRIQSHRLEFTIQPQDLNDILSQLRDQQPDQLELVIQFPPDEAAVAIDYGFLLLALKLLFSAENGLQGRQKKMFVATRAGEKSWSVDITGVHPVSTKFLRQLAAHQPLAAEYDHYQAEAWIRLILAYWICRLQQVAFEFTGSTSENANRLSLIIPMA